MCEQAATILLPDAVDLSRTGWTAREKKARKIADLHPASMPEFERVLSLNFLFIFNGLPYPAEHQLSGFCV
jgi:hypothetical protein